jgi:hypothetical protein
MPLHDLFVAEKHVALFVVRVCVVAYIVLKCWTEWTLAPENNCEKVVYGFSYPKSSEDHTIQDKQMFLFNVEISCYVILMLYFV